MNKLLLMLASLTLLLTACDKEPYADFTTSKVLVETGELVYFTNRSFDAHSYEWDFGDGYYSNNFNASHSYTVPGRYVVSLTAFGKDNKMDKAFVDIDVFANLGSLRVVVSERFQNYIIAGARVRLYPTKTDWDNETNLLVEGIANSQGIVLFENLQAQKVYYIDIYEARHNNYYVPDNMIVSPTVQRGLITQFEAKAELSVGALEITVLEYFNKYPIYDASVRLYPTVKDWEDETNMIVEGFTNTQGRVIFTELEARRVYYVDVWEKDHDNYKLAAEDVGFIETLELLPGVTNQWTAYVDYYEPGKKAYSDRKALKKHYKEVKPSNPRVYQKK
jgi:hypothetical protein